MRVAGQSGTGLYQSYRSPIIEASNRLSRTVYESATVPLRVFEAARIATAVVNGCRICMNWQAARDAAQMNLEHSVVDNGPVPDDEFYNAVLSGTGEGLSEAEAVAAEYARQMGADPQGLAVNDDLFSRMHACFTDDEIVELTFCIASWMGTGRVAHVLGTDTACEIPAAVRP